MKVQIIYLSNACILNIILRTSGFSVYSKHVQENISVGLVKGNAVYKSATDKTLRLFSVILYTALNMESHNIYLRNYGERFRDQSFVDAFQHTWRRNSVNTLLRIM